MTRQLGRLRKDARQKLAALRKDILKKPVEGQKSPGPMAASQGRAAAIEVESHCRALSTGSKERRCAFEGTGGYFAAAFFAIVITALISGSWLPIVVFLLWIIGMIQLFAMLSGK